ncbi:Snf7-domain-containing protein [Kickxella alabastrina]|uniref:Snf7-domain-containing protein n=1 Tax=Kickxella alabastrina TaxID=61397 RepID=UPI00221EA273|nr:Snf7-domain-containing protein [Kickxella alabastrina]KAI7827348.1 Snf7-domain-containing protein [Kickxella alabastrina]
MFNFSLFAKPPKPEELVRKWRASVRSQERELDRQIRGIATEEAKVKRTIQQLAKKNGDLATCRTLAKELVRSARQTTRLYKSKAQLNSILLELTRQAGLLKKSTQVMRSVNQLVRLPQLQEGMREMEREMVKAGIIGEMTEEAFEMMEESDLEEEADLEVEAVLAQVTDGMMGSLDAVKLNVGGAKKRDEEEVVESDYELENDPDAMLARLSALRS